MRKNFANSVINRQVASWSHQLATVGKAALFVNSIRVLRQMSHLHYLGLRKMAAKYFEHTLANQSVVL